MFTNLGLAQENSKAVELNNTAMELYQEFLRDTSIVEDVLKLLDKSIELDSLYYIAYFNKTSVLKEMGRCEDAVETLDKLVFLRPDLVGYWSMGGYILERMGYKEEAKKDIYKILHNMIL